MEFKVKVPTSLMEISISDFLAFYSSEKTEKDVLKIYYKLSDSVINAMTIKDIRELVSHINDLFSAPAPFYSTFILDKEIFGFIPKLDDMTMSEYADLDTFGAEVEDINKYMAVLYRPLVKEHKGNYLIEPYDSDINYHGVMMHAPIGAYLGARGFFLTLKKELLKLTLDFLAKEVDLMNIPNNHNLEKNGDGIHHSIHSLKATLEDCEKLENSMSMKH
jgi:hypothetical protein